MDINHQTNQTQPPQSFGYRVPIATRLLLFTLLVVSGVLSAVIPVSAVRFIFGAVGAGIFAFSFLVTVSPVCILSVIPAFVIALFVTGSVFDSFFALTFLPAGVILVLSLLKQRTKTQTVLATTIALGLTAAVFYLIYFMQRNGTIAPASLLEAYHNSFAENRILVEEAIADAAAELEQQGADVSALLSSQALDIVYQYLELFTPAVFCLGLEILGYVTVSVYLRFAKAFRCTRLIPHDYMLTCSKLGAVVFLVSMLLIFFSDADTDTVSFSYIVGQNLFYLLIPCLFVIGLTSLKKQAKDPLRRKSFIVSAVLLFFILLRSPIFFAMFIALDGVGEVFFHPQNAD